MYVGLALQIRELNRGLSPTWVTTSTKLTHETDSFLSKQNATSARLIDI
jgi:hypothetical protein